MIHSASRRAAAIVLLFGLPSAALAQPSGYYTGVDTSSASALRATVHAIIDDHIRYPYT